MELYSVVFLSSPIPVTSWDQLLTIFDVAKRFRYDYFNGSQQVVIITLCFWGLSQIKKLNFRNQDFSAFWISYSRYFLYNFTFRYSIYES